MCAFAHADVLDLFHRAVGDRGLWAQSVAFEVKRSASKYPMLRRVESEGWLGEPITIEPEHVDRVDNLRKQVFGVVKSPLAHMGEAESLFLINNVPQYNEATWISDDFGALDFAHKQGIAVMETFDLLSELVCSFEITAQEAMTIFEKMQTEDAQGDYRTFATIATCAQDFEVGTIPNRWSDRDGSRARRK